MHHLHGAHLLLKLIPAAVDFRLLLGDLIFFVAHGLFGVGDGFQQGRQLLLQQSRLVLQLGFGGLGVFLVLLQFCQRCLFLLQGSLQTVHLFLGGFRIDGSAGHAAGQHQGRKPRAQGPLHTAVHPYTSRYLRIDVAVPMLPMITPKIRNAPSTMGHTWPTLSRQLPRMGPQKPLMAPTLFTTRA